MDQGDCRNLRRDGKTVFVAGAGGLGSAMKGLARYGPYDN